MKAILLALAWTLVGLVALMLVAYIAGALGLVDDYKWGRLIGKFLLFPSLLGMVVSGVYFARGRRRAAFWITGLLLAAVLLLDTLVLIVALKR